MREATAVGDLNSTKPGSGARKNEGKAPLDLVPVRFWHDKWCGINPTVSAVLEQLCAWQERKGRLTLEYFSTEEIEEAARVFEFGAKKYKEWNWAKGMPWSVPLGCALRHMRAMVFAPHEVDKDSGYSHKAHLICNIMMLMWYEDYYKEGDDRPPIYLKTS